MQKPLVETRSLLLDRPFHLESGDSISPLTIAYEIYGEDPGTEKQVILIEHALSGSSHAAFYHEGETKPGWWDD
ncbi:MAG: homoserine O-acetyltransferase, partial [Desulfomonilia bacterium]|nr:homoserine O-acetyltransferase [Desulfomonilia bacterium]